MRTEFRTPSDLAEVFIQIAEAAPLFNSKRPERFIKIMETNTGVSGIFTVHGLDENTETRKILEQYLPELFTGETGGAESRNGQDFAIFAGVKKITS